MSLTVSWSQLRLYEECKQKAQLHRSGKRAKLADNRVFFGGTVVDRVVRDWLADSRDLGEMPGMVADIMDREEGLIRDSADGILKWRDSEDRARVESDCKEAVKAIEPALVKYVLPYEYQVDYRFRTSLWVPNPIDPGEMMEMFLIGAMDILVHNPLADWWAVFDVKMTRDDSYWKKTQGQMTFYDLQIELERGQPARAAALFQPLCTTQVKTIPMDEMRRMEMRSRIMTMVDSIIREDMPTTTNAKLCGYCDYKHACPKFTPVIRPDGKKTMSY